MNFQCPGGIQITIYKSLYCVLIENLNKSLALMRKIANEVEPLLPEDLLKTLNSMRGHKWPGATRNICMQYNQDECEFYHLHKQTNNFNNNRIKIHVCAICVNLFNIGMAHPSHSCPTLGMIDKQIESNNAMQQ